MRLRDDPGFRLALGSLPGSGVGLAKQPTIAAGKNAPTEPRERGAHDADHESTSTVSHYPTSPRRCTSGHRALPAMSLHGYQQYIILEWLITGERAFMPIHVYDTAYRQAGRHAAGTGKTPTGAEFWLAINPASGGSIFASPLARNSHHSAVA